MKQYYQKKSPKKKRPPKINTQHSRPVRLDKATVIKALKKCNGVKTDAADMLGVSRHAIIYWCDRYPEVNAIAKELRKVVTEVARDNIARTILDPVDPGDKVGRELKNKNSLIWLSRHDQEFRDEPGVQVNNTINNNTITVSLSPELEKRRQEVMKQKIDKAEAIDVTARDPDSIDPTQR